MPQRRQWPLALGALERSYQRRSSLLKFPELLENRREDSRFSDAHVSNEYQSCHLRCAQTHDVVRHVDTEEEQGAHKDCALPEKSERNRSMLAKLPLHSAEDNA